MIRTASESDYPELLDLFRSFFKVHNRFQQPDDYVIDYIKETAKKHELLVYEDGRIKGALFLVNFGQNADGTHKLWKFRHFAFESEEAASKLLEEAERRIRELSRTAKIELTIAETEEGIDFYRSNGYLEEGALKNHYRHGETTFILGKSLS